MQQELQQVLDHLVKLTQAQMSGIKQKENMEELKISRHQIAWQRLIVVWNWCL